MGLSVLRLYERRLRAPNLKTCKLRHRATRICISPASLFANRIPCMQNSMREAGDAERHFF